MINQLRNFCSEYSLLLKITLRMGAFQVTLTGERWESHGDNYNFDIACEQAMTQYKQLLADDEKEQLKKLAKIPTL